MKTTIFTIFAAFTILFTACSTNTNPTENTTAVDSTSVQCDSTCVKIDTAAVDTIK